MLVIASGLQEIVMENACEAFAPKESVALIVGVVVWEVVGVPEITPVEALSDNPAGKEPAVTLHEYGGVPPLAETVVL